jgi:hypothetical protein
MRRFQLHLADTGVSICTRNCIMTGLRFLFRVTLRRLDLAAEIYHIREPQKLPQVGANVASLRTHTQLARVHVFDHTLTQRGDSLGCHKQLLSWMKVGDTPSSRQDAFPRYPRSLTWG